ncbi:MAG: alanine racemase [Candidatus Omnitrophica bacterium]|nr:alanine racemase [Candidatus Omnitrophota bacterium]
MKHANITRNVLNNAACLGYAPTWIEIDLSAIRHNFRQIKKIISKETAILAPVKANAYGHGILEVSRMLVDLGVDYLGVGTLNEAMLLRSRGFCNIPVLMMGVILGKASSIVVDNNITQAVGDINLAAAIDKSAGRRRRKAKVHIKIDTGMGRIGVWHKDAMRFLFAMRKFKNLEIEGIFSHFASSDADSILTHNQIAAFNLLISEIEKLGFKIRYKHMANSMAVVDYQSSHMNLIRPGLILYGLWPKHGISCGRMRIKPALSLKSRIVFLKSVPPGRIISYGATHTTDRHTKIATIPIGYGDGLSRGLSNIGHALVRGVRVPIVGRICMDQTMLDVGNVSHVKKSDAVTLIGSQSGLSITVDEIAGLCDTIPYEVVCWFNKRIPRKYKN